MPFLTPAEFQDLYSLTRREVAEMIIDEGMPTQHGPQGLLIDQEEAELWLEEQGYLVDEDGDE